MTQFAGLGSAQRVMASVMALMAWHCATIFVIPYDPTRFDGGKNVLQVLLEQHPEVRAFAAILAGAALISAALNKASVGFVAAFGYCLFLGAVSLISFREGYYRMPLVYAGFVFVFLHVGSELYVASRNKRHVKRAVDELGKDGGNCRRFRA